MNQQVNSIILGAGSAQRMGQTKQLLTLRDKVLLHHVIDQVRQVNFEKINTVIGHDANEIQRIIRINDSRFHWITNNAYKKGISTSLKKGLQYCSKHPHHIMVFLGDMPFIKQSTIRYIMNEGLYTAKGMYEPFVIRPMYKRQIGHPVFFGYIYPHFFDQLEGDVGAKAIVNNMKHVKTLPINDEGIILDIDTPEAYAIANKRMT